MLLSLTAWAQRTVISGKIIHPASQKIALSHFHLYENLSLPSATLNADNTFKLVFDLPYNHYIRLEHGENIADFFVMPGDSVFLTFDMVNMDSTMTASGTHAPHYNYWSAHYHFVSSKSGNYSTQTQAPEAFMEDVVLAYKEKQAFFDDFVKANQAHIDPAFIQFTATTYYYRPMIKRMHYVWQYAQKVGKSPEEIVLPTSYYQPIEQAPINQAQNWGVPEYDSFLENYLHFHYDALLKKAGRLPISKDNLELYELGKILLQGEEKWQILAMLIDNCIRYEASQSSFLAYDRFMADCPDGFIKNKLSQAYEEVQLTANGQSLPDFVAVDMKGDSVHLSDFKGKVIYLAFWNTNCAPCFYEMRHANQVKLAAEFGNRKDIVFVYVCADRSVGRWKESLKENHFEALGIHLYDEENREESARATLGIQMFPTHYIIGKEGQVINAHPAPISSPKLIQELQDALK